ADWIRTLVRQHGAWANIPPKRNRTETLCFSPYLYRARNLVERFFNKIKHCRRVATRYDKLAANYLAFIQLASIRLWLRVNEFTSLSFAFRSISIFFLGIIFALVVVFGLCPSYCLNLFSCFSYNNTPYLNRRMLAVWSVCPTLRHVAGVL